MKIRTSTKIIIALIALTGLPFFCQGQVTATNTFFQSFESYFTSFNTNLTAVSTLDIWSSADTLHNDRTLVGFGGAFHPAALRGFDLECHFRNDTLAGSITTIQGGFGYSLINVDTRLTGYLDGGYDYNIAQVFVAPGVRVSKMLTPNTFSFLGIEVPFYTKQKGNLTPTVALGVGFNLK